MHCMDYDTENFEHRIIVREYYLAPIYQICWKCSGPQHYGNESLISPNILFALLLGPIALIAVVMQSIMSGSRQPTKRPDTAVRTEHIQVDGRTVCKRCHEDAKRRDRCQIKS